MKIACFALSAVCLGSACFASPFMVIGDGAELHATGTVGVRADDNIFLSANAQSDVIFDVNPGVELSFGKNAQVKGALTLVESFASYADNSDLNANLFAGDFSTKFDDGKMKLGIAIKFHELNQNQFDRRPVLVGGGGMLNRRDVFAAGGTSEVELSQLTLIGSGVSFDQEKFKLKGFSNLSSLTIPVDLFYRWSQKTDLSLGYRYRDSRVDVGQDSTDHFFNVGARGEFSPKLTGRLAVGVTTRKPQGGGDNTLLGFDSSMRYELSPKSDLEFGASNDFGTSSRGQQEKNLTLRGSLSTRIADEWMVNGGLQWRSINSGGRTDDYVEAQLGTSYVVNANVRIRGSYVHRDYSTVLKGSAFKNNVFAVDTSFRF